MLGNDKIGIRQLFERESCTYTYLVWDKVSLDAVLIDGVVETFSRDKRIINEMGVRLKYLFETHVHADHITSASLFLDDKDFNVMVAYSEKSKITKPEVILLSDNEEISISENLIFKFLQTPGHTNCSGCFILDKFIFTGDTLLIKGCGRTDFQEGSSDDLYESVHNKIYALSDCTVVLPGHDYNGELYSTIGEEKLYNPRLKLENTKKTYIDIMNALKLSYPTKIDSALIANQNLGRTL